MANGNLEPWKDGDALSAAHLNQAWQRLLQLGQFSGGYGVLVSQTGHGTSISSYARHQWVGQWDGRVLLGRAQDYTGLTDSQYALMSDDEYDALEDVVTSADCDAYDDPRYLVQPCEHRQADGTTTADELLDLRDSVNNCGGEPPDDVATVYNLWEHDWQSHFLREGERVTVHVVRTTYAAGESEDPPAVLVWYATNKAPTPIRSGQVSAAVASNDQTLTVLDEYQLLRDTTCQTESTITISDFLMEGSDAIEEGDTIHYVPTGKLSGYLVGFQFTLPPGGSKYQVLQRIDNVGTSGWDFCRAHA